MAEAPVDLRRWPQRKRAIVLSGLTAAVFDALEEAGKVKYRVDFRGRRRYDPTTLSKARDQNSALVFKAHRGRPAARPTGEVCAAIFEAFERGDSLRAIVIAQKTSPEYVAELRRQYAALAGDLLVSHAEIQELRELLGWDGNDGASLIEAVNQRLRYQFQRGRQLAEEEKTASPPTKGKTHATLSGPEEEDRSGVAQDAHGDG